MVLLSRCSGEAGLTKTPCKRAKVLACSAVLATRCSALVGRFAAFSCLPEFVGYELKFCACISARTRICDPTSSAISAPLYLGAVCFTSAVQYSCSVFLSQAVLHSVVLVWTCTRKILGNGFATNDSGISGKSQIVGCLP